MPLEKPLFDSVIDSAGGAIAQQVGRVQRQGGRIVIFGMTVCAPSAVYDARGVAEPAAHRSEQTGPAFSYCL